METNLLASNVQDEQEDILSKCLRLITDANDVEQDPLLYQDYSLASGEPELGSASQGQVAVIETSRRDDLGRIVCELCRKEFHTQSNLKVHHKEIHQGLKGEFTCADCGQVYTRLRSLERHQNKAHLKDTPQCRICRKKVVNFEAHYRKFHCKSVSIQVGAQRKRKN